jgi:hypothetical protein
MIVQPVNTVDAAESNIMKIPYLKFDEQTIKNLDYEEKVIQTAITAAAGAVEHHDTEALIAGGMYVKENQAEADYLAREFAHNKVSSSGAHFFIPLAVPEGVASGDERSFEENSITIRDLPLPLMWQIKTGAGHDGSVVVGRIDSIERIANGVGNARGVFDTGVFGREAERLVRGKFIRGVSVDLDKFSAFQEEDEEDTSANDELGTKDDVKEKKGIKNKKLIIDGARLMGITIVPKPAFQECYITIEEEPTLSTSDDFIVEDGVYESMLDDMDSELAALAASAAPVIPPASWFENPRLNEPTPLTVTDDGQVFGHIAAWHVDHIGRHNTKPPRSASKYAYFRTGVVRTDDGNDVRVGQLTLAGGHASLNASAASAQKHYDDTASAVADITVGEDSYGIWCAGALRPDIKPEQVRALRASAPSGDWRPIGHSLELVAVCQVNVPGFPITRALVAGGQIQALVAAGAQPLAELRQASQDNQVETRLRALEIAEFTARRDAAIKRMEDVENERTEKLKAMVASAEARMADDLAAKAFEKEELKRKVEELQKHFNS